MIDLSFARRHQNTSQVLKCLQENTTTQEDLDDAFYYSYDSIPIRLILILAGANAEAGHDDDWTQVEILHMLNIRNVDMNLVTLARIYEIERLLSQSEPLDAPEMGYVTIVGNVADLVHTAAFRGHTKDVKRLITQHRVQSTGADMYYAAMNQYVETVEVLIASGARMSQFTPKIGEWPWWVRNTQRRVLQVCARVNQAIWIVRLQFPPLIPPEVAEIIVNHLRESVFDLASWNGQREWKTLETNIRGVLREPHLF